MPKKPRISVVISTFGNYEGLRRVLDSYEGQTAAAGDFEVLVVGDAADPHPERIDDALGTRPYPLRRLTGHRPGLSANRNTGWSCAAAELVLFTDNDTLATPALLSEHLSWHRDHPGESVAVLGHVRWARELKVTPFMHWLEHGMQFDYPNIRDTDAGWGRFYGANVSVKRSLVERVGGFDERRLPYGYEDLDFGYRAHKAGFRLLYNRAAVVEHLRVMDIEFWRARMPRLAQAERTFTSIHPEIDPYYKTLFEAAQRGPRARGRGRRLIKLVPRGFPLVGRRAWASADRYYRQALAPAFLDSWAQALEAPAEDEAIAPDLREHEKARATPSDRSA